VLVVERVLVGGISGAGKTTMAERLAERFGLPRYELDALHHGPNWQPRAAFQSEVEQFARSARWVTEDQYHGVLGDLLIARADTFVWLDLPRGTVMFRVIRRSVIRALTRRELWNGNRESIRNWLDPEHPIRWAWSQHAARRNRIQDRLRDHPHLSVIRLPSARAARQWYRHLDHDSRSTSHLPPAS
jgi:adenylate kinase family enzyme